MNRRNSHVLIAEDEVICAFSLAFDLRRAGFRVTVTHDGRQALQADGDDPADLLLTDLQMPRLGGLELIRCMRAKRPMLPVIIMTGRTLSRGVLDDAVGPTLCIAKPFSDSELFRALGSLLPSKSEPSRTHGADATVCTSPHVALRRETVAVSGASWRDG